MQERDGRSIAIEGLDDIHLEKNHRPTDLLQLKHHITPCADLTDSSKNLWTTIREWVDYIQTGNNRVKLIEAITVLDAAPTIQDLEKRIDQELATRFRSNQIKAARESIQGWWEDRILTVLLDPKQPPISPDELNEKIQDIRDSLQPESLPNNFSNVEVPKDSDARAADRPYLKQGV